MQHSFVEHGAWRASTSGDQIQFAAAGDERAQCVVALYLAPATYVVDTATTTTGSFGKRKVLKAKGYISFTDEYTIAIVFLHYIYRTAYILLMHSSLENIDIEFYDIFLVRLSCHKVNAGCITYF